MSPHLTAPGSRAAADSRPPPPLRRPPADGDCSVYANANSGCGVADNTGVSYGAPFAANGGGVWATELAATGVSVWFFPRPKVPANLQNSSMIPDPATWGTPSAFFADSSCSIDQFFGDQQLVINLSLCGDWAGNAAVFGQTCSGTCTDLVADPSNYNNAYFEIKSVRVYTDSAVAAPAASSGASSPASTASSTTSSSATATASAVKGVCSITASSSAGRTASRSLVAGLVAALSWVALF